MGEDDDGEGEEEEEEEDDDDDDGDGEGDADAAAGASAASARSAGAGAPLWTRAEAAPTKARASPVISGGAFTLGKAVVPAGLGHAAAAAPRAGAGGGHHRQKKERRLRKGEMAARPQDPYGTEAAADAALRAWNIEEQQRVRELSRIG
jgi:hypothetical protein